MCGAVIIPAATVAGGHKLAQIYININIWRERCGFGREMWLFGREMWLSPVIQATWEARAVGWFEVELPRQGI
jgi:hypothetical protein